MATVLYEANAISSSTQSTAFGYRLTAKLAWTREQLSTRNELISRVDSATCVTTCGQILDATFVTRWSRDRRKFGISRK